jgi:hypothetical protein
MWWISVWTLDGLVWTLFGACLAHCCVTSPYRRLVLQSHTTSWLAACSARLKELGLHHLWSGTEKALCLSQAPKKRVAAAPSAIKKVPHY